MNVLRKILVGLGSIVVVALVLALAAPETVHAVVSTLVTVVNSVAVVNPAPGGTIQGVVTEETMGASRQPVEAGCESGSINTVDASFSCVPYTVPADKRLVIEYADGSCTSPGNISGAGVSVVENGNVGIVHNIAVVPQGAGPFGGNAFVFGQSLRLYADPSTEVQMFFVTTDKTGDTSCGENINGYLEPANVQ